MHRTCLILLAAGMAAWADSTVVTVVSAASPVAGISPASLASVFGPNLATVTESAKSLPWPTRLGDISVVYVTDAASNVRMAPILYVSPTQMNIFIPGGMAPGPGTVSFPTTGLPPGAGTAALRVVPMVIQKVAPALFSVAGTGTGVAAATAVRVVLPTQIQSPVTVFRCDATGTCSPVPIDVGLDAPVYLSLYGTGISNASSLANVKVTIGSVTVQPTYAGAQGETPGLDQVNVPLPLSLRGSGVVNVTVTVDGVTSNAVQVAIQ